MYAQVISLSQKCQEISVSISTYAAVCVCIYELLAWARLSMCVCMCERYPQRHIHESRQRSRRRHKSSFNKLAGGWMGACVPPPLSACVFVCMRARCVNMFLYVCVCVCVVCLISRRKCSITLQVIWFTPNIFAYIHTQRHAQIFFCCLSRYLCTLHFATNTNWQYLFGCKHFANTRWRTHFLTVCLYVFVSEHICMYVYFRMCSPLRSDPIWSTANSIEVNPIQVNSIQ